MSTAFPIIDTDLKLLRRIVRSARPDGKLLVNVTTLEGLLSRCATAERTSKLYACENRRLIAEPLARLDRGAQARRERMRGSAS